MAFPSLAPCTGRMRTLTPLPRPEMPGPLRCHSEHRWSRPLLRPALRVLHSQQAHSWSPGGELLMSPLCVPGPERPQPNREPCHFQRPRALALLMPIQPAGHRAGRHCSREQNPPQPCPRQGPGTGGSLVRSWGRGCWTHCARRSGRAGPTCSRCLLASQEPLGLNKHTPIIRAISPLRSITALACLCPDT